MLVDLFGTIAPHHFWCGETEGSIDRVTPAFDVRSFGASRGRLRFQVAPTAYPYATVQVQSVRTPGLRLDAYWLLAGASGAVAGTPSRLMLNVKNVKGVVPGFPHWWTSPPGS